MVRSALVRSAMARSVFQSQFPARLLQWLSISLLGFLMVACGGGGSGGDGDSSNTSNPAVNLDPVVSTLSTEELSKAASDNLTRGLDSNLDGILALDDSSLSLLGSSDGSDSTVFPETPSQPVAESQVAEDSTRLINKTLGLFENDNAVVTRSENRVTIDPDEVSLCSDAALVDDDLSESDLDDFHRCQQLLADLTVQIDATSEDSGTVAYLFQNTVFVTFGYGPSTDSFELNLGGLKLISDANDALDPDSFGEASTPDSMQGALRLTSVVNNDSEGAEAGSLALDVTQDIAIADSQNSIDIALGTGNLFSISADAATESGVLEFNAGAARLRGEVDEDLLSINLEGFTGRAEITAGGDQLIVSNLGIGNGPIFMTINDVEFLRATMETFGFEVGESSEEIVLNGNLNLALILDNSGLLNNGTDEVMSLMLDVAAPAGTGFFNRDDGSVEVTRGGPFSFSYTSTEGNSNASQSVVVEAGQCFSEIEDSDDIAVTVCQ